MIKKIISVTSHALDPPVTNCHTFSDPLPSSVTYFMDGPINIYIQHNIRYVKVITSSPYYCRK